MEAKARPTQTRVKHEILKAYLKTWGGIISSGLRARQPNTVHLVYVDCFASTGKYAGECEDILHGHAGETVYGSPIIGIRALDALADHARNKMGVPLQTSSILIERNTPTFQCLMDTLTEVGLSGRARQITDFKALADGEIAVVNADSISMVGELLGYTSQGFKFAFYLVDPRGPSGIPYDFVKQIVRRERHDVMINFIYEDLVRKTGMCLKNNLSSAEKKLVNHWTAAFGGEQWKEIAREAFVETENQHFLNDILDGVPLDDMPDVSSLSEHEIAQVKEWKFVDAYRNVLRGMDPGLTTKLIDLMFPEKDRTMFYLFLTTHDPTGALALNKILSDAKYLEYELRSRLQIARQTPVGQLSLFAAEPSKPESPTRPSIEHIGEVILQRLAGTTVRKRDVYRTVANDLFFASEVDKALRLLKSQGKAEFMDKSFAHNTEIRFATCRISKIMRL